MLPYHVFAGNRAMWTLSPAETLSEKKQDEKDSPIFLKMPSEHYMEVANLLLSQ